MRMVRLLPNFALRATELMQPRWTPQLENDSADADTPVTLSDQENINAFSKLNSRSEEVTLELKAIKQELDDVEEVETEMELMDEDEEVMYVILSTSRARRRLRRSGQGPG